MQVGCIPLSLLRDNAQFSIVKTDSLDLSTWHLFTRVWLPVSC